MGGIGVRRAARAVAAVVVALAGLAVPAAAPAVTPSVAAASPFAVVGADGTLVRGQDAVSTTRLGTGFYVVVFDASVTDCAYVASPGDPASGGVQLPGSVSTAQRATNPNGVF